MQNKKEVLYDILFKFSILYREKITDKRLAAYTNELIIFEIHEIVQALNALKFSCTFFPSLAEIYQKIKPAQTERDLANDEACKILEAARNYSQYDKHGPKEFLGELWPVADSFGWNLLTTINNDQISTTRAQLRDYCLSFKNSKYRFSDEKKLVSVDELLRLASGN